MFPKNVFYPLLNTTRKLPFMNLTHNMLIILLTVGRKMFNSLINFTLGKMTKPFYYYSNSFTMINLCLSINLA